MCFGFALQLINGVVDECGNSIVNYKNETINKIFIICIYIGYFVFVHYFLNLRSFGKIVFHTFPHYTNTPTLQYYWDVNFF